MHKIRHVSLPNWFIIILIIIMVMIMIMTIIIIIIIIIVNKRDRSCQIIER